MENIKVKKTELLKVLSDNRTTHRKIFEEALIGFKSQVIALLEQRLDLAKQNKKIDLAFHLQQPVDQTKDYDRAIRMITMHTEDIIELSEHDFKQYVMDDWGWKNTFLHSNASYSKMAMDTVESQGL